MAKKKDPIDDLDLDKDDDFNFDDLDNWGSDFDDMDVGGGTIDSGSDRNPASKSKVNTKAIRSTLSAVAGGVATHVTRKVESEFPKTHSLAQEALNISTDVVRLKQDFSKDIEPTVNQLKNVGRRLLPRVKGVIPDSFHEKLTKKLAATDYGGDSGPSVAQTRDTAIAESLQSVFAAEQQIASARAKEEEVNRFIDRRLTSGRHQEIAGMVNDIRTMTMSQVSFNRTVAIPYMKKNLELKYRHLYVSEDILGVSKTMMELLEKKLDEIRHNTSLPEVQKEQLTEAYKAKMRDKVMGGLSNYVSDFGKNVLTKIKTEFLDPTKDMMGMLADIGEGALMGMEMDDEMAEMDGRKPLSAKQQMINTGTGWVAGLGGGQVGKYLSKKAAPLKAKYGDQVEALADTGKMNAILALDKIKREGLGDSDVLSALLETIVPDLERHAGRSKNKLLSSPEEHATFDVATRQSIVEIIPGYLGKILQQVTQANSGKATDELVYDPRTRDFISAKQFQTNAITTIFGDKKSRTLAFNEGMVPLRKGFEEHGGDVVKFDKIMDQLSKVFFNLAKLKDWPVVNAEKMKAAHESGDMSDNYIKTAFAGVKYTKRVLSYIVTSLYKPDGTLDKLTYQRWTKQIMNYMENTMDKHKTQLDKYTEGFGMSRHMKDVFRDLDAGESGTDISVGDEHLRNILADIDLKLLKDHSASSAELKIIADAKKAEKEKTKTGGRKILEARKRDKAKKQAGGVGEGQPEEGMLARGKKQFKKETKRAGDTFFGRSDFDTASSLSGSEERTGIGGVLDKLVVAAAKRYRISENAILELSTEEGREKAIKQLGNDLKRFKVDADRYVNDPQYKNEVDAKMRSAGKKHYKKFRQIVDKNGAAKYLLDKAESLAEKVSGTPADFESTESLFGMETPDESIVGQIKSAGKQANRYRLKGIDKTKSAVKTAANIVLDTTTAEGRERLGNRLRNEIDSAKTGTISNAEKIQKFTELMVTNPEARAELEQEIRATVSNASKQEMDKIRGQLNKSEVGRSLLSQMDKFKEKFSTKEEEVAAEGETPIEASVSETVDVITNTESEGKKPTIKATAEAIVSNVKTSSKAIVSEVTKIFTGSPGAIASGSISTDTSGAISNISLEGKNLDVLNTIATHTGTTAELLANIEAYTRLMIQGDASLADKMSAIMDSTGRKVKDRFGKVMGGIGSTIMKPFSFAKKVALSPFRKIASIYKSIKGGFKDIFLYTDLNTPLVTKRDLARGLVFGDGRPVTDITAIDKPVYNPYLTEDDQPRDPKDSSVPAKMVISMEHIGIGLVDEKGQPLLKKKGIIGKTLGFAKRLITGGVKLGLKTAGWMAQKYVAILKGTAGAALDIVRRNLNPFPDVYTKDMTGALVLLASGRDIKSFGVYENGDIVKSSYDINKPVVHVLTGDYLVREQDIRQGLFDAKGNPFNRFGIKLGKAVNMVGRAGKAVLGAIFKTAKWAVKTGISLFKKTKDFLFKGENPYIDVFVKGQIDPTSPVLFGEGIKKGWYCYADGSLVESAYGIDQPVFKVDDPNGERNIGNCIINSEQLKLGLVNLKGETLSKWSGRSLVGKAITGAFGVAKSIAKTGWNIAKGIAKGASNLITGGLKGMFGEYSSASTRTDLQEVVGDRLDIIIRMMKSMMPKKHFGDRDNDGLIEGSWQDTAADDARGSAGKADNVKSILMKALGAAGMGKAAAAPKLGSSTAPKAEEGGSVLGDAASWAASTAATGWLASKFGIQGGLRGMATSALKGGGKGLWQVAKRLPKVGKYLAIAGAGVYGVSKMTADDNAAIAATGKSYTDIATGGKSASSTGKGNYAWQLFLLRCKGYGIDNYYLIESQIDGMEKLAQEVYATNKPISDDHYVKWCELFGIFLDGGPSDKDRIAYMKLWWEKRFLATYFTYLKALELMGMTIDSDLDLELSDTERADLAKLLNTNINTAIGTSGKIIPNKAGCDRYLTELAAGTLSIDKRDHAGNIKTEGITDNRGTDFSYKGALLAGGAATAGVLGTSAGRGMASSLFSKLTGGMVGGGGAAGGVTGSGLRGTLKTMSKFKGGALLTGVLDTGLAAWDISDKLKAGDKAGATQLGIESIGSISGGMGGMAAGAALGSLAGPVGTVIGGMVGYAFGAWGGKALLSPAARRIAAWVSDESGPGLFGKNRFEWGLFKYRCSLYGIEDPVKMEDIIDDLEEHAIEYLDDGADAGLTDAQAYDWAERFGFDLSKKAPDKVKYWLMWYKQRFLPVLKCLYGGLKAAGLDWDEIDEVTDEQCALLIGKMDEAVKPHLSKISELKPNMAGYDAWSGVRKTGGMSYNPRSAEALATAKAIETQQRQSATNTSQNIEPTSKDMDAVLLMQQRKEETLDKKTVNAVNTAISTNAPSTAQQVGSQGVPSSQAAKDATYIPSGAPSALGSMSASNESGTKGSRAIGWDRNGGTSYGKYQFAAKVGGLSAFVAWAMRNGGEAFARRMIAAVGTTPPSGGIRGWGDEPGKTSGSIVDAWNAAVDAGELGNLEHRYIAEYMYPSAMNRLTKGFTRKKKGGDVTYPGNPDLVNMINSSKGLQEMMWSMVVQHGAGGASGIAASAYTPGMTAEDFAKKVYAIRSGSFGSSTEGVQASVGGRFQRELQSVLGMIAKGETSDPTTPKLPDSIPASSIQTASMSMGTGIMRGTETRDMSQIATATNSPIRTGGNFSTAGAMGGAGGNTPGVSMGGGGTSPAMAAANGKFANDTPVITDPKKLEEGLDKVKTADQNVDISNLHPKLRTALAGLNAEYMERFGTPLTVTSGFRSLQYQQMLYDKLGPSQAAKPSPTAPHMFHVGDTPAGIAFDASSAQMNKADEAGLLAKYGLHRPLWPKGMGRVKPEPWHVQMVGLTKTTADDLGEPGEKLPDESKLAEMKDKPESIASSTANAASSIQTDASVTSGQPDMSTPSGDSISTAGFNTGGGNIETASSTPTAAPVPTSTSSSNTPIDPNAISSMQLEQLKLMVASLTNIDMNTAIMAGWDMGSVGIGDAAEQATGKTQNVKQEPNKSTSSSHSAKARGTKDSGIPLRNPKVNVGRKMYAT